MHAFLDLNVFFRFSTGMVALDDQRILSLLFKPRYLGLADASQLERVSHRFLAFSRRLKRNMTRLDMKSVMDWCKQRTFLSSLPDQFPNLTALTNASTTHLGVISKLPNMSELHLTELKLSAASLAQLKSLPNLRRLSLDSVQLEQDFSAEDVEPLKLSLDHLTISKCKHLHLLTLCRLEQLTSLKLQLPVNAESDEQKYAAVFRQCVNLKSVVILANLMAVVPRQPILCAVAALACLPSQPRLECQLEIWNFLDVRDVCANDRVCQGLTRLHSEGNLANVEQLLMCRKLPHLRHVTADCWVPNPERIFEAQPSLESLQCDSETVIVSTRLGVAKCSVRLLISRLAEQHLTFLVFQLCTFEVLSFEKCRLTFLMGTDYLCQR